MKRIKKIVLKDATKLTNSEMKQIRGGYEPERSSTCSMECPVEYGGSSITLTCEKGEYCDLKTDSFGLACYNITTGEISQYPITEWPNCERVELP